MKGFLKEKMGPLIALAALVIIISVSSPYFMTYTNIVNVIRQIATMAMVAYAATFCLISGNIDLSVGSTVAFSGVVLTVLLRAGLPFVPSLLIGVICGTLVGVVNGIIVAMTGLPPFIVTLGMQSVVRGVAYLVCNGTSVRVENLALKAMGNGFVFKWIPIPAVVIIVTTIVCSIALNKTIFGRSTYACGGNREAAQYSGINVKRINIIIYTIAGTLSGIGGVLLAGRVYSGQPTAGSGLEGDAISAAVLGGVAFSGGSGSISAAIIGTLIIGVMNNALNLWELSSFWQMIVKGLILLVAVYVDTAKKKRENRV